MRMAGLFLMLAGWAIAVAAVTLLTSAVTQLAFILISVVIEILGFAFIARTHMVHRGGRLE